MTSSAPTESATFQRLNEIEIREQGKIFPVEVISFFGHRENLTRDHFLTEIRAAFPTAVWLYREPNVTGFLRQIQQCLLAEPAESWRGLEVPDKFPLQIKKMSATFKDIFRAYWIIDRSDLVVFSYDGRQYGATFEAFRYAKKQGKPRLSVPTYRMGERIPDSY